MLDPEVVDITLRSLAVSGSATLMATLWSLPIAFRLAGSTRRLSQALIGLLNALVSVPTVIVGLALYMLFSRSGPLGFTNILYTPHVIALGEALLITPLLVVLLHDVFKTARADYWELAIALGASGRQAATLVVREAAPQVVTVVLVGFARAIGELGVALLVGGNIKGYTRVLTTSIALEVAKGEFEKALSLGLVLLLIVAVVVLSVRALRALTR